MTNHFPRVSGTIATKYNAVNSKNARRFTCEAGSLDNYRNYLYLEKYCITKPRTVSSTDSLGCYIGQAVLKPTGFRFACVHIFLYACSCVCVYIAAFARVHIRQCLVACTMPMYISTQLFVHACVYVRWCLLCMVLLVLI